MSERAKDGGKEETKSAIVSSVVIAAAVLATIILCALATLAGPN